MISGVIFVLVGEAAVSRLWPLAAWAAAFLAMNLVHIPFIEERRLVARFGEPYRDYCRHVRRFVPRLTPWTPRG
jgi:protein-S-isoprenylcysteine O-methyltransferase Ste14